MNKSILVFAVTAWLGAAAHAEDPAAAAASPFSANISLTTNYKYRGQDQGSSPSRTLRPAVQGGFDWTQNGFYLGNWNSSIGWAPGASVEMDFYGGYRGEITKDLTYDVGILRYQYNGAALANTTELYGLLGYGPLTVKYSSTISRDYFGYGGGNYSGRNTGYLDVSGNFPVVDLVTVNAHVGYTHYASDLRNNVGVPSYYDYKLGLTYDLSKVAGAGVTISGAIVGANKTGYYGDINKGRFIATLTKTL